MQRPGACPGLRPTKPALTVCVGHLREGQPHRPLREELPYSSQTYLQILGQREAKETHKPSLFREKSLLFHGKHSQGIANLAKTSSTTAKIQLVYGTFIIKGLQVSYLHCATFPFIVLYKNSSLGDFPVIQWLRLCTPMQGWWGGWFLNFIYLFFSCAGSSLLQGLFSNCGEQGLLSSYGALASHCSGFSCC